MIYSGSAKCCLNSIESIINDSFQISCLQLAYNFNILDILKLIRA